MANDCYTSYYFTGDAEEIQDFYTHLKQWLAPPERYTVYNKQMWLGNCLIGAGLGHLIDTENGARCRGYVIDYFTDKNSELLIATETAWEPMAKMWHEIIKVLGYSTVKFCYLANEPNMGIFEIYDPDKIGHFDDCEYHIDVYLYGEDEKNKELDSFNEIGDCDHKTLLSDLRDYFNSKDDSPDNLIKKFNKQKLVDENSWVEITPYKYTYIVI